MEDYSDTLKWLVSTRCGSPIEEMFSDAWIDLCREDGDCVSVGGEPETFLSDYPEITPTTPLHVWRVDQLMYQVKIEEYRVDFVLGRVACDWRDDREVLVRLPLVIVECDGHDYHDRTKEQAQRDKSRDRRLNQLGYRVLRFTGSELYRDADQCAKEVDALFQCLLKPGIADAADEKRKIDELLKDL